MSDIIRGVSEAVVLIFDLLIYMQLTVFKKNNRVIRIFAYTSCAVFLGVFFGLTYTNIMPEALASFVCVTLPSFILFFILSKYKDFRFFVTFCLLDTVTLILTFFSRSAHVLLGDTVGLIGAVFVSLFMITIYIKGRPYFCNYRELIENVKDGWGLMALSTCLIYILLIFSASYPKPLIERQEYFFVYAFLSICILVFYAVLFLNIVQKKKLADLNAQLMREKDWHTMAYYDTLTGIKNRMAYMEQINVLERSARKTDLIHVVMIDIDHFKEINDTLGHHMGDLTLKNTAQLLNTVFPEDHYMNFRIGGDEFVVISQDVPAEILKDKISFIKSSESVANIGCSFSVGYSMVDFEQKNAMENAFIRADRAMYQDKLKEEVKDDGSEAE